MHLGDSNLWEEIYLRLHYFSKTLTCVLNILTIFVLEIIYYDNIK